jgi:hypothetical protein
VRAVIQVNKGPLRPSLGHSRLHAFGIVEVRLNPLEASRRLLLGAETGSCCCLSHGVGGAEATA